jgi:GTP cyclohydrolase FolE2
MVKEHGGIPHMQRAEAAITGLLPGGTRLEETITLIVGEVCDGVKLIPNPIMKRIDELTWCQQAEKTNLFVEDAARLVGSIVSTWFDDWSVVCTHFESIHQHNAVAVCRKGEELS